MAASSFIRLLDVGSQAYGDALLCQVGGLSILVDGAHPGDEASGEGRAGLLDQLAATFGHPAPFAIDLLVVSHAHLDHIGALPTMVGMGAIKPAVALVADPDMGWGVTAAGPDRVSPSDSRRAVVAGLREEPLEADTDDARMGRWLADAVTLEDRYRTMLANLTRNGTTVIRHVRDSHAELERSFQRIGLRVLGPTEEHVLICAGAVLETTHELEDRVQADSGADLAATPVDLYRAIRNGAVDNADTADAVRRLGAAINLQSIVLSFVANGQRVLLTGDMEFASTDLPDSRLKQPMAALRRRITRLAPYGFVKLPHHGSSNGIDGPLLDALGTPLVAGIMAGSRSRHHPSPAVLGLLASRRGLVTWARTDRNGASLVDLSRAGPDAVRVSRGAIDDDRAGPEADRALEPTMSVPARQVVPGRLATGSSVATQAGGVEVVVRVPAGLPTRVVIEIEPIGQTVKKQPLTAIDPRLRGKRLDGILAVTSRAALADNIGATEADRAIATLEALGATAFDLPDGVPIADATNAAVTTLRSADFRGVLLLGGFDVVPSAIVDTLPPEIRQRMGVNDDHDDYIVWSDDLYGDTDADGLSELPISRIPDGKSGPLVATAISAQPTNRARSAGLRNLARPFAENVYAALPGQLPMLVSDPTRPRAPTYPLAADLIYLMLHGDWEDADRFEGEMPGARYIPAIDVEDIGRVDGAVVLAGCCWGALSVDTTARDALDGRPFASRTQERSMALSFLGRGAQAFVGCTGVHYSPIDPPLFHYGEPMHHYFFEEILRGSGPAQALFDAKRRYGLAIPHGPTNLRSRAIEYKIWRQFTCLGIGW